MIAFVLAAAVNAPASIRNAVMQRHGASTHVARVIVHGDYALAVGRSGRSALAYGLHVKNGNWSVTCTLPPEPMPPALISKCGFPQSVAIEVSANEATQTAAERGRFDLATIAAERAFESAKGPDKDQERARVQLLHQLNDQMRTGRLTRAQAIAQWNQFRYSFMLP